MELLAKMDWLRYLARTPQHSGLRNIPVNAAFRSMQFFAGSKDIDVPELPEVETVRRGLEPVMVGGRFSGVQVNRPNLRFSFPERFADRLTGASILSLDRRGKYIVASLSSGEELILHLGMSGRFTVHPVEKPRTHRRAQGSEQQKAGKFVDQQTTRSAHDHVIFSIHDDAGKARGQIVYNDPRRFGFMDLVARDDLETCRHFSAMGPEPLGNQFSAAVLGSALRARKTPIKTALLDQRVVAGLGNIYVCEALFRAGISPRRLARNVPARKIDDLYREIIDVLREAIEAGGSSLRDFAASDGAMGYFQHGFKIYGREGEPCHICSRPVTRIVQAGRSTFFCGSCQR